MLNFILQIIGVFSVCYIAGIGLTSLIGHLARPLPKLPKPVDTGDLAATIRHLGNTSNGPIVDMVAETRRMGQDAFKQTPEGLAVYTAWKRSEQRAARRRAVREFLARLKAKVL